MRHLYNQCQHTRQQLERLETEVITFEMTIPDFIERWVPTSPEYIDALGYMKVRHYNKTLDTLHKLVIQRLLELDKLNLAKTGLFHFI